MINNRRRDDIDRLRSILKRIYNGMDEKFRRPNQVLGQRSAIGCVALEITQRCNLDCTLCYLSENSESVSDLPIEELKRRLDQIKVKFGVGTNVQITGGDPTLRQKDELIEIVRYTAKLGLYPALFTNGLRASRELLKELKDAGLMDVAFHVDLTQEIKGYRTEDELNRIRERYIERARGLGLCVIFNTTLFEGNAHELGVLVDFFKRNSDVVSMCSFQLHADTGRSILGKREKDITIENVQGKICQALGTELNFDSVIIGHPKCHKIAYSLIVGDKTVDLVDDVELFSDFLRDYGTVVLDRRRPYLTALKLLGLLTLNPRWMPRTLKFVGRKVRENIWDLIGSGFKSLVK